MYELENRGVMFLLTAGTEDFLFTNQSRTNLGPKKMPTHLIPWDPSPRIKLSGVMLKTNLHLIRWESMEFYLHSPLHTVDTKFKFIENIYNFNFEVLTMLFVKFQSSGTWRHNRRLRRTCPFYPKDSRRRVSSSFFMGYPRDEGGKFLWMWVIRPRVENCFVFTDVNRLQIIMHYL